MNVTATAESQTYNGSPLTCDGNLSGVPSGSDIKYGTSNGSYTLTSAPTITKVADTKTIYYQVTNPNYNNATGSFQCTVNRATITATAADNTKTYNGTALTCDGSLSANMPSGSTIKYGTSSGSYTLTSAPTITNVADTKTIYYQVVHANYNTKTGSFKCTVTPANMNVTATAESQTYNGSPLTCDGNLSGVPSGSDIKYGTSSGSYTLTSAPKITNVADTKTIYYQVTNPNYNNATGSFKCTVNRATITATAADNTKTYNGTALTCDGSLSANMPSGSTIKYGTSSGSYTLTSAPTITNVADSKTIYYQVVHANYSTKTGSFECVIEKAENPIILSAYSGHVPYGHMITIGVSGAQGELSVASSNTSVATVKLSGTMVQMPAGSSYGTATITVTAAGNENYLAGSQKYTLYVDQGIITLEPGAGTGGTTGIYQQYNTNVWLNAVGGKAMTTSANPITIPSRNGYAFAGYYADANSTTALIGANGYITSDGITAAKAAKSNITWVAKWTPNTITINYDSNGGTSVASTTCKYDSTFVLAAAPANSGKQFSNWSVNGGTYNAGATINCNYATLGVYSDAATIKANWGTCPAGSYCPTDGAPLACPANYPNSAAGATSRNDCYLKTTAGNYVASQGAGETACISPYYCTGGSTIYYGGTGTTTGGTSTCTSLGAIYTASDAGASKDTQCYATTTKGNWVASAKATAESTCTNAYWCAGSTKVYYGNTGGREQCPAGYRDGTTGYSAKSQCLMNVAGGKYVATANESSASGTCGNWTFKGAHSVKYGETSSCASCPSVPDAVSSVAWTKASGTGWSSYSSCIVSQTPANCASGKVQRTANSATTWGNTTLVTTLKSKDGYYAGTSATSCTAAADGKYATAGSTTDTACAIGSYSEKASASSKCIACPAGRTTSGTGTKYNATAATACSTTCSNSAGVSAWATPSWSANSVSNLCKISDAGCQANYYQNSNACSTCSSGTNSKYTLSDAGTTSVNSCYLKTTAGKYVATKNAAEVTCKSGGYYCSGDVRIFYGLTGGISACTDLSGIEVPNGTYSTSPSTGASAPSACRYVAPSKTVTGCSTVTANTVSYTGSKWNSNYYTVTAAKGYHVGNNNVVNPTCVMCGADKYQALDNSTATSCTSCLANYHTYGDTAADHDAASDCQISCDGGSYLAKANDTTCSNVGAGYWAQSSMVAQGSAGSRTQCKNGWTTIGYGFGANEEADCGRIFNYGNQKIYLRSAKRDASQPALHVKIGDVIFYGTMKQVSGPQSGFNAEYGGKNYLITNDDQ